MKIYEKDIEKSFYKVKYESNDTTKEVQKIWLQWYFTEEELVNSTAYYYFELRSFNVWSFWFLDPNGEDEEFGFLNSQGVLEILCKKNFR